MKDEDGLKEIRSCKVGLMVEAQIGAEGTQCAHTFGDAATLPERGTITSG